MRCRNCKNLLVILPLHQKTTITADIYTCTDCMIDYWVNLENYRRIINRHNGYESVDIILTDYWADTNWKKFNSLDCYEAYLIDRKRNDFDMSEKEFIEQWKNKFLIKP